MRPYEKKIWQAIAIAFTTLVACSSDAPQADGTTPPLDTPSADAGIDPSTVDASDDAPDAAKNPCGNRKVETGEECDDGNELSGDGCSSTCRREPSGALDVCPGIEIPLTDIGDDVRIGSVSGSTKDLHNYYAGTCGGSVSNEAVYSVTSDVHGILTASISSSDFDAILYARAACEDTKTQSACNDGGLSGGESIRIPIEAGQPVFLFVDGYGGLNGDFTLDLKVAPSGCGDAIAQFPEVCDDGNQVSGDGCSASCTFEESGQPGNCPGQGIALKGAGDAPRVIHIAGDLSTLPTASDQLTASGCTATGTNAVYQFRSDVDGMLKARLVASYANAALHARNECNVSSDASGASSQLDCKDGLATGAPLELTVPVTANLPVWVIVDTNSSSNVGPYLLDVIVTPKSCGDGVRESGEACDDGNTTDGDGCSSTCTLETPSGSLKCPGMPLALATTDGSLYTGVASGSTKGLGNNYSGTCNSTASGVSEDAVYAIDIPENGTLRATVTADFSAMLYLQSTCGGTQVACATKYGGLTPEPLTLGVTKGQKLFLVVDGRTAFASGQYTVRASFTKAVCGNGVIDGAETCDDGNAASGDGCSSACILEPAPTSGDTCAAPGVVTMTETTPGNWSAQVVSGNTNLKNDNAFSPNQTCPSGGNDAIYTVVAPLDGVMTVKMSSNFNGSVGARTEGNCPTSISATTPLVCTSVPANSPKSVHFAVSKGKLYYLIADASLSTDKGAFTLDVTSTTSICGDGLISGNEACDDGNTLGGDGCSSTCALEPLAGFDTCPGYALPIKAANGVYSGSLTMSTAGLQPDAAGTCGGSAGEGVVIVTPPVSGKLTATLTGNYIATFYVRTECSNPLTELACFGDSLTSVNPKTIEIAAAVKGTPYYFFVDGSYASTGVANIQVKVTP